MKKCPNCNTTCADNDKFCANCGCPIENVQPVQPVQPVQQPTQPQQSVQPMQQPIQQEQPVQQPVYYVPQPKEKITTLTICAIVFTFLISWVGLLLSCIGRKQYEKNTQNRKLCDTFAIVSGVFTGIEVLVYIIEIIYMVAISVS